MNSQKSLIALIAVAGALAAGAAQARGSDDVRWSVTIGSPAVATPPVYWHAPPVVVRHAPPPVRVVYQQPTRWDRDGDGIPNRRDRLYNPRWDRDGDGVPNRQDRVYNPQWDRDGDGIPNRRDPRPDQPQRGGWGR